MKKQIALVLAGSMLTGMLAACGSGSATSSSTATSDSQQLLEGSLISAEPQTFTIFLTIPLRLQLGCLERGCKAHQYRTGRHYSSK